MSGSLDRRLTAPERAPGAGGVDLRVFSTVAEADADAEPTGPGGRCHASSRAFLARRIMRD